MNLRCYYCAKKGNETIALVTVHDKRACVHVCWEHAKWRMTTSSAFGHSPTCAERTALQGSVESGGKAKLSGG